ncbi:MAG: thrombospondin type 3 repeat-containing protein [Ilumatobacter sp.]|uniref:thrombospondin type 3 repeat-containing protein n=1 Tax=Ilumatobacter sp. TaxID=1967498 RepID=UPI00391D898F
MRRHLALGLVLALSCAFAPTVIETLGDTAVVDAAGATYFVDQAALPGGDGSSWASPFTDLQAALALAVDGDDIWVAEGTYVPTTTFDRSISFVIPMGVDVLGGFRNGQVAAQRDPAAHPTILSGNLGQFGDPTDNSYHVVRQTNGTPQPVSRPPTSLDGLTIRDGYADGTGDADSGVGGGILLVRGSPFTLRNVIVRSNVAVSGGAAIFRGSAADDVIIIGSLITDNGDPTAAVPDLDPTVHAIQSNVGGNPLTIRDSTIGPNRVGGIRWNSSLTLVGTDVVDNDGGLNTYGVFFSAGNLAIAQSRVVGNAGYGALRVDSGAVTTTATMTNTIVANNSTELSSNDHPAITVTGRSVGNVRADLIGHNVTIAYNARDGFPCAQALEVLGIPGDTTNRTGGVGGGAVLSSMSFSNSILWNQDVPCGSDVPVVDIPEPSVLAWNHSIVGTSGGSGSWDTDLGLDQGGNIDADPDFVLGLSGTGTNADYRLRPGSAAIDVGDQTALPLDVLDLDDDLNVAERLPVDLDGFARVQGAEVDAGAYEGIRCPVGATRLYVQQGGTGLGGSWGDALGELTDALAQAPTCDSPPEIWVAEGTYFPTETADRTATFDLLDGVRIYGGFEGDETSIAQRTLGLHPTVLSGNIPGDNSYHVVRASAISSGRLDGFTITSGVADGTGSRSRGAGVYVDEGSVELVNLVVRDNQANDGAGLAFVGAATPTLANSIVRDNTATDEGGGIWIDETAVDIVNSVVADNTAVAGGGLDLASFDGTIVNSTIVDNTASGAGDQLNLVNSAPAIANSIVDGGDDPVVQTNLFGPPTWRHNLVDGSGGSGAWDTAYGTDLGGNLDAPPLLDATWRLRAGSPGAEAGDDVAVPADSIDVDSDSNLVEPTPPIGFGRRITGSAVDLGAFEGLDSDGDNVSDADDNCPTVPNPDQQNSDFNGEGDACDPDDDDDGVLDDDDNCRVVANPDQVDTDGDGDGDACDPDDDGDGVLDGSDNCIRDANPTQSDVDDDGIGDACDPTDDRVTVTPLPTDAPTLVPLEPARLLDTRPGEKTVDGRFAGEGRVPADSTLRLAVSGRGGIDTDATAVVINVTAINPSGTGFLTVYECDTPIPNAATLTYQEREVNPNLAVAGVVGGDVCIYTFAETHLTVDVNGLAPGDSTYVALEPARLLDTRPAGVTNDGIDAATGPFEDGEVRRVLVAGRAGVPAGATAAVLNISSTGSVATGFATAWPCDAEQPTTANLNFAAGRRRTNLSIVSLSDAGEVCLFVRGSTELILDVLGAVEPDTAYTPLIPARLLDTRSGLGISTIDGRSLAQGARPAGSTYELDVAGRGGVPVDAEAVVLNVAVINGAGVGFVTVFPCGERPLAANLNFVARQTVPNLVFAKLSPTGTVCVFQSGGSHLAVDVFGSV